MENNKENCIFCKIINKEISADIVYEDDNFMGIKDINPQVEGHSILIIKKHFKTMLDVPNSLGSELLEALKKMILKLMDEEKSEGFNLHVNGYEVAGQLVPHAHIHILPRKKDDGFKPCA